MITHSCVVQSCQLVQVKRKFDKFTNNMGGKSSKSQNLSRNNSVRKSQRKIFQRIQKRYVQLQKDVNDFRGELNSPTHLKVKSAIMNVKFELEELKNNLKEKHNDTHAEWTKKIDDLLTEINVKAEKRLSSNELNSSGKQEGGKPVELTLIQLVAEKRSSQMSLKDFPVPKSNGPPNIEMLRQEVLRIRKQILAFKGTNLDDEYIDIKDRLVNIFIDIDNVDISYYPQLRRERNLGMDDVQNCFKLLEEVVNEQNADTNDVDKIEEVKEEEDDTHRKKLFTEFISESSRQQDSSEDEGEFFVDTKEGQSTEEFRKPTVVTSF